MLITKTIIDSKKELVDISISFNTENAEFVPYVDDGEIILRVKSTSGEYYGFFDPSAPLSLIGIESIN